MSGGASGGEFRRAVPPSSFSSRRSAPSILPITYPVTVSIRLPEQYTTETEVFKVKNVRIPTLPPWEAATLGSHP
jgi:hypothetical protein